MHTGCIFFANYASVSARIPSVTIYKGVHTGGFSFFFLFEKLHPACAIAYSHPHGTDTIDRKNYVEIRDQHTLTRGGQSPPLIERAIGKKWQNHRAAASYAFIILLYDTASRWPKYPIFRACSAYQHHRRKFSFKF